MHAREHAPAGIRAGVIADPITPGAVCGGWQLQSNYGDRWPAASTWWEYSCTFSVEDGDGGNPPDVCWGSLCQPGTCWGWPYNCYSSLEQRTDFFVWDGGVVFYGQAYDIWVDNGGGPSFSDSLFWDGPTATWSPRARTASSCPRAACAAGC